MNEPTLRTRSRHISFSSTVAETFVIRRRLTEDFTAVALEYWKKKGLAVKDVVKPADFAGNGPVAVQFVAEGGTIWTTDFESYKKTLKVTLFGKSEHIDVTVQMTLPGGLMSMQDREKAADMIGLFIEALEIASS